MPYQIENYSEKAIAIFGDTEGIKDQLIELGGKFNPHLRGRPGWIFPKSKENLLMKSPIFANAKPQEQADDAYGDNDEVVVPQKRLLKPTSQSQSVETLLLDIIERLKRIEERLN